jgi:molybdenum cofactor cytidylyltransferase
MERLKDRNAKTVINEAYREGMTRSVQTGIAGVSEQSRAVVIALVDQPRISPNTINRLIDAYEHSRALIVKPRYSGQSGHPIIIDLCCRDEILSLGADCGLNKVTRAHASSTLYVDVDCRYVIEDIDTPEDYERQILNFSS